MFLGARVDDALSTYHRHELEHGDAAHARPAPRRLPRPLDPRPRRRTGASAACAGTPSSTSRAPSRWAWRRSRSRCAELVPRVGRAVAVQRELAFSLAPGLEWTIQGFLDLETLQAAADGGEPVPAIVDYKVKNTPHSQAKADHDPQAGLYLAGRWLAGDPAERLLLRPDRQARQPPQDDEQRASSPPAAPPGSCAPRSRGSRRPPARSPRCYDRYGPDEPWGFADPGGWKCSPRYCAHHARCPGGGGLG